MNINLFAPHNTQKTIIDGFATSQHKFGVVSCGRQMGKSLLGQNLMLFWLLSNPNQTGGWVSPIYNQAKKVFQELVNASHQIVTKSNKADLTLEFVNGSTLQFLSAERYDSIRGFSFSHMVIDEAAFIKKEAMGEAILPTLTALGKKCLIISTPKGKNWFFDYYMKGSSDNDTYISFDGISIDNPYVDQAFIEEQRKSLPSDIFQQEYMAKFTDAGQDVFRNVDGVCMINEWTYDKRRTTKYYCGIDLGLNNDFSVLTIIDDSGAVAYMDRIKGTSYQDIIQSFSASIKRYNIIGGYVETNGPGLPVFEQLKSQHKKLKPFVTTNESKNSGIRTLIYDIQEGNILLPSKELFPALYTELNMFTYKLSSTGKVQFSHPSGGHDDTVISLMLANEARNKFGLNGGGLYVGGSVPRNQIHPSSRMR